MIKKIVGTVLIIVLVVAALIILTALGFRIIRGADKKEQTARLERLRGVSNQSFSIPDTEISDNLLLNNIRFLATHNSYRRRSGFLQLAVLELFEPGESSALDYSHPDYYTQLGLGVRSFELDLRRYRDGSIKSIHVPLVDNRGHSPDFEKALEEMLLWSKRHPQHVPIIVIMEIKQDWRFLDPALKRWTAEGLLQVDRIISQHVGERLLKPSDMKKNATNLRDSIVRYGWPELGDCRGKFIFVYHESDAPCFNADYLDSPERVSFYMSAPDSPEASFMLRNDPDGKDIGELIDEGFIVRTRADAECLLTEERKDAAIASGAQIVSTDFPLGYASGGSFSLGWEELLGSYQY